MRGVAEFLIKIVVNAVAIWVAAAIVQGVEVTPGNDDLGRTVLTLLAVGLLFGLVNAVVKPVVKFFAFPFYILTLGLMAFVVNALMLVLVSWLSGKLGISFHIDEI